jgi:hypothetical protein
MVFIAMSLWDVSVMLLSKAYLARRPTRRGRAIAPQWSPVFSHRFARAPDMQQTVAGRLKIGLSACFQHADPARSLFTNKTLQYFQFLLKISHGIMNSSKNLCI